MTNQQKGIRLIREARLIFGRDLTKAYEDDDYNMTRRRAQEVVELCLKGALHCMAVDFPKEHDVGGILVHQAKVKGCPVEEETLKKIASASTDLAETRNTSFYGEEEYSQEEARIALEQARFVLEVIERHFTKTEWT